MKKVKKFFKVALLILVGLFVVLLIAAHILLKPSSDEKVRTELSKGTAQPHIFKNSYKGFDYRVITMQKELDSTLPVLVFVHGSPGSNLDYKRYFNDTLFII